MQWIKKAAVQFCKRIVLSILVISIPFIYVFFCTVSQQLAPMDKKPFVHWSGLDPHHEVFVTWETTDEMGSSIRYGTSPDSLIHTLQEDGEAMLHRIRLTGLAPGTEYYYQSGPLSAEAPQRWSEVQRFKTAPDTAEEFSVVCVSDTQQIFGVGYYNRVAGAINKLSDTAFVVNVGDLCQIAQDQQHWNQFFRESVFLDHLPLVPCPGNHDDIDRADAKYLKYFGTTANDKDVYYAFDWGRVRFIVAQIANASHQNRDNPRNEIPFTWLEETLAASQEYDYRILFFHRDVADLLAPLVEKYNVSLALHGHVHSYARYRVNQHTYVCLGNGATVQTPEIRKSPDVRKKTHGAGLTRLTFKPSGIRLESFTPAMDRMDDVFLRRDGDTGRMIPEETSTN